MKEKMFILFGLVAVFFVSCGTIPSISTDLSSMSHAVGSVAQTTGAVDFKSGEVLASIGNELDPTDMYYLVSKVLTPASPATKNQAEVLFVQDGKKDWCSFVIPSHKASKEELTIGRLVFVLYGWENYDAKSVNSESYRMSDWRLERITSIDELFKNRVEVGGGKYDPGLVRIPDFPLD